MFATKLTLEDAQKMATAILPHTSKDEYTPIITAVLLHKNGKAIATDRYTVGMYTYNAHEAIGNSDDNALISREAIDYITKIKPTQLRRKRGGTYFITIENNLEKNEDKITIIWKTGEDETEETVTTFDNNIKGNYPPVEALITKWKQHQTGDPTVGLAPKHTAKMFTFANKYLKDVPITYTLGKSETPEKPGPIKCEMFDKQTGNKYIVLQQPNLLSRVNK